MPYESHDNPYLDQYAGTPIAGAKKAKSYWGSILGAAKNGMLGSMPGMSLFDNQIAKLRNQSQYESGGLAQGPVQDRIREMQLNEGIDSINEGRQEYAANQLQNAAQGIAGLAQMRNSANAQKYGTLIGGENARYDYKQKQPGFWSQFGQGLLGKFFG